jgi:hypothetical protein
LGVLIQLPSLSEENKIDLQHRMWDPVYMKDYVPIPAKPSKPLSQSCIKYYKNGKELGVAFQDVYFGTTFLLFFFVVEQVFTAYKRKILSSYILLYGR